MAQVTANERKINKTGAARKMTQYLSLGDWLGKERPQGLTFVLVQIANKSHLNMSWLSFILLTYMSTLVVQRESPQLFSRIISSDTVLSWIDVLPLLTPFPGPYTTSIQRVWKTTISLAGGSQPGIFFYPLTCALVWFMIISCSTLFLSKAPINIPHRARL